jgi:hypothetical protein
MIMTNILGLLKDHSAKDAVDALYYAARTIKQSYLLKEREKDFFDDESRSAPSDEVRALSLKLVEVIEAEVGKKAADFDSDMLSKTLGELWSAEEAIDIPSTTDDAVAAGIAIGMMVRPTVTEVAGHHSQL